MGAALRKNDDIRPNDAALEASGTAGRDGLWSVSSPVHIGAGRSDLMRKCRSLSAKTGRGLRGGGFGGSGEAVTPPGKVQEGQNYIFAPPSGRFLKK